MNKKIRNGISQHKYSYILCCGEKDILAGKMTVRDRDTDTEKGMTIPEIIQLFKSLLPKRSGPQENLESNAYRTPEELSQSSTGNAEFTRLNEELKFKTFLKGDGFEFTDLDKSQYQKLKDTEIDKHTYSN